MTKILIIEDEFDIREEVADWLRFEGYEVCTASNGRQGLAAIFAESPDLVLCDIAMPEMDGHQVLIEVRSDSTHGQMPFIFVTAAVDREAVRKGMNLGADDYLTKPFTRREVLMMVEARLGKQQQIQTQLDHLSQMVDAEREQRLLKTRQVGMFSHDFRTPLTTILSSSSILQMYGDRLTAEQWQKHFRRIDGSVQRLIHMLDDMLLIAGIENGRLAVNPRPTDLAGIIHKVVDDFVLIDSASHPISVDLSVPPSVELDPMLVEHILINLVSNAVKYSPPGSPIHIRADTHDHQIWVAVQDAGIGIPEKDLPNLFTPFFRAGNASHIKGTGLGLALVSELLTLCSGTIDVTSELDRGSCFTIALPLNPVGERHGVL